MLRVALSRPMHTYWWCCIICSAQRRPSCQASSRYAVQQVHIHCWPLNSMHDPSLESYFMGQRNVSRTGHTVRVPLYNHRKQHDTRLALRDFGSGNMVTCTGKVMCISLNSTEFPGYLFVKRHYCLNLVGFTYLGIVGFRWRSKELKASTLIWIPWMRFSRIFWTASHG